MKVVKTPSSVYVLYALAIVFLCIATFEIVGCYSDIRSLIDSNDLIVSENMSFIISYYLEHVSVYFGIAFLLYAAGVISAKLNEVHQVVYQMAEKSKDK